MCPSLQPGHRQGTGDLWQQELLEPMPGVSTSWANLAHPLPLAWSCGILTGIAGAGGSWKVVGSWFGMGRAPAELWVDSISLPSALLEESG